MVVSQPKNQDKNKLDLIKKLIKKGNITPSDIEWLQMRIYDNRWMQLEMVSMFDDLKNNKELSIGQRMKLLEIYGNLYSKLHGDKVDVKVEHVGPLEIEVIEIKKDETDI